LPEETCSRMGKRLPFGKIIQHKGKQDASVSLPSQLLSDLKIIKIVPAGIDGDPDGACLGGISQHAGFFAEAAGRL